jgi:hypothetical protein
LAKDYSLKTEKIEEYRLRVEELFKLMKKANPSPLTQELKRIIEHQNYIGLTSIISKFIKSFISFEIEPLKNKRE